MQRTFAESIIHHPIDQGYRSVVKKIQRENVRLTQWFNNMTSIIHRSARDLVLFVVCCPPNVDDDYNK